MFKEALQQVKTAVLLLVFFTLLTGVIYPLTVTCISQLFFPWRANGSLLSKHQQIIGSALIGQPFNDLKYFWGRPSATPLFPYNALYSSGSNLGPSNPLFINTVASRITELRKAHDNGKLIPVDLVTASASGLDPHISPLAALYQVSRVAKARNLPESDVQALVISRIKQRKLWILGEPRINVLKLNLALDKLRSPYARAP